MQLAKFLYFLLFFLVSSVTIAQSSGDALASTSKDVIEYDLIEIEENWKFFLDEANSAYFIDFEALGGNLTDLTLIDSKGNVLFEEDLWEIPSNTIYELDLSSFGKGDFKLEIRSYTNTIYSKIHIK